MSSDTALKINAVGKCYEIYESPHHRLLQMLPGRHKAFYKEFWALRDVSFEVKRGECVGIIGRNGSGKSTLLQIIAGTLAPGGGSVEIYGKVAGLLELGSGFNPEFTGRENVFLNGAILGLSEAQVRSKFDAIAAFADIGEFMDRPVKIYSSGMYMRLAFAIIAHVDAEILVIDEALAVGDAFFVQKCMRFLRKFMETGTILFVSHDAGTVQNLCRRALWLESGRVKGWGPAREVCEAYLEAIYEKQQGAHEVKEHHFASSNSAAPESLKDQRLEWINSSRYRNDIELFQFDEDGPCFGKGGAVITDVRLFNLKGEPLSWVVGGETVVLSIAAKISQNIFRPVIGFFVKDKLGQSLFGDTTYLKTIDSPLELGAGQLLEARFTFQMPLVPVGDYSICAAVGEGTPTEHVQHHWIHDALFFKAHASSVQYGCLVGIPMQDITLMAGE